jgi:hypothetical protein
MRAALAVVLLSGCYDHIYSEEAKMERARARQAHWEAHYMPYITAACDPAPKSVECERAKLDARAKFLQEESMRRGGKMYLR